MYFVEDLDKRFIDEFCVSYYTMGWVEINKGITVYHCNENPRPDFYESIDFSSGKPI